MSQAGRYIVTSGPGAPILTITGNVGGPVPPTAGNIDLLGTGEVTVTGNPGLSTLTISLSGAVPDTFDADAGTAIPVLGILNIFGGIGGNIHTTGAGNIIDIFVSGTTNHAVQIGNATGSLTSIGVGTNGQVLIGATGADPAFANLTSTGGTIAFTIGANTLNLETSGTGVVNTLTGNTGGALSPTGGNITIITANTTAKIAGLLSTLTLDFNISNLLIGAAGGAITSGLDNTGLGQIALASITSGSDNTAVGYEALALATTGSQCTAMGSFAMLNATIGASSNTAIGYSSLYNLKTGTNNTCLGQNSGVNLTLTDSANLLLASGGVVGDNNTTRIGTSGTHNKCFIAGIDGVNVGSVAKVLTMASDQIGTATITAGSNITVTSGANTITIAATTSTILANYTNVNTTPYVVLLTDYYLSVDVSSIAITVQLPNAPTTNRTFVIKDRTGNAATINITVTTVGGVVLIDGATSQTMNTNYEAMNLVFNGTSYEIY